MNKISFSPIVILFTLCILVGCARSTDTNTSTSTSKGASTSTSTGMPIQKPISTGSQSLPNPTKVSTDGTKIPTQQEKIFWLRTLWESKSQVIDAFYIPENKKLIEEWVWNKENWATSSRWDIIEFLYYCEKVKSLNKDKKQNLQTFSEIDLIDIKTLIATNKKLEEFAQKNSPLSQKWFLYVNTSYSTELIRQFYVSNPNILKEDPSPYAVNEIYAFLNNEISDTKFLEIANKVIAYNHQWSKLYTWMYKDYYLSQNQFDCRKILQVYGRDEENFQKDE